MNKLTKGYSTITVISLLSTITISLTLALIFVSFYLHLSSKNYKKQKQRENFFKIMETIKKDYFEITLNEAITSPFEGWFREIPENINGYNIKITVEDSKLDINHIDISQFFKNNNDFTFEKIPDYFFYETDVKNCLNIKSNIKNIDDIMQYFTIYNIPNINISDIKKINFYLKSINMDTTSINLIINTINNTRSNNDYLKYKGTNLSSSGLLITNSIYESFKNSSLPEKKSIYEIFDYKGQINLNFISEKVFEISVKACIDQNINYNDFWSKIKNFREAKKTITEADFDEIFGFTYIKKGKEIINIRNWLYFEKIFSVDSNLFKIIIEKDDNKLTAYFKRFKDEKNKIKVRILKVNVF